MLVISLLMGTRGKPADSQGALPEEEEEEEEEEDLR